MEEDYIIYVRDTTGKRIAQVDQYKSLAVNFKSGALSSWTLEFDDNTGSFTYFTKNSSMVLERNGVVIFSGPVTGISKDQNWTIKGTDDLKFLQNRLAYPVPDGPPFSSNDYDVRTGLAETVIKAYVNANAGPGASTMRQIPGMSINLDYARGQSITGRARFENLLDFVFSLSLQGGVIPSMVDMVFDVTAPRILSDVLFSVDLGTLADFKYNINAPKANHVIVGGVGSGSSRVFSESEDGDSVVQWGRVEMFVDNTKASAMNELQQAGLEALGKNAEIIAAELVPVAIESMIPFDDYWVGDAVKATVDGMDFIMPIQEIDLNLSADQATRVVTKQGSSAQSVSGMEQLSKLYSQIRMVNTRVSSIEQR